MQRPSRPSRSKDATAKGDRSKPRSAPASRGAGRPARPAPVAAERVGADGVALSPTGSWLKSVEQTVAGFGYDLIECERSGQGLLRVYIDRIPGQVYDTGPGENITVDDCEKVTRQLQYVLEVEACDYSRLEVSSPGLDRPLKKPADFARFAGNEIEITLKLMFQGRKKYRGVLEAEGEGWQLVFNDGKQDQVLGFTLDEIREARLVPVVDFKKGRGRTAKEGAAQGDGQETGGREE